MVKEKISKHYRERILAALKAKGVDYHVGINYQLSVSGDNSIEFTLRLKTQSLTTKAKRTQLATCSKGLIKEFGESKGEKDPTIMEPNFTFEDTSHINVVKLNLLRALKVEYPDIKTDANGKIALDSEIQYRPTKKSRRSKKRALKTLIFSPAELMSVKETPVGQITQKMLDRVVGKNDLTLTEFLQNKCNVWSSGEGTIYKTKKGTDALDFLKSVKGNRRIKESHVRKLMRSYRKEGFLFRVMYLNEYLEVIDGQHGIEAARRLGLPIYFMVMPGWGKKEVTTLNVSSDSWTLQDFMHLYAEEGNPNYVVFREFFENHWFDITTCQIMILKRRIRSRGEDIFKEGKLIVTDLQLARAQQLAKEVETFENYHPKGCYKRNFVQALQFLYEQRNYKFEILIAKYEEKPDSKFYESKPLGVSEYINMLITKYNENTSPEKWIEPPVPSKN